MSEINLIYKEPKEERKVKSTTVISIMIIVFVVFIGVFFLSALGLRAYYGNSLNGYNKKIEEKDKQISLYSGLRKQKQIMDEQLIGLNDILENHIYWSKVFDELTKYAVRNVYFRGFDGDVEGQIKITGSAKSYSDISDLLLSLKKSSMFNNIELESAELNDETKEHDFNITVYLTDQALKKGEK